MSFNLNRKELIVDDSTKACAKNYALSMERFRALDASIAPNVSQLIDVFQMRSF